jgi:peptidoglycan/LPS O-acetylase OafA/YrhL
MAAKSELKALTGVRFIAAFYVFIFHIDLHTPLTFLPDWVRMVVQQGSLGVNFFFVLSGFLLAYSHLQDFTDGGKMRVGYYRWFLFKRFSRIYPVYFAGLLLSLGVSMLFGQRPPAYIILLNTLMLEAYTWWIAFWWYGTMAWSVSAEFFFYLLFPLLLPVLLSIRSERKVWGALVGMCLLSALPGLVHNISPNWMTMNLQYAFPPMRLAEFVAGMLTAIIVFRFRVSVPSWMGAAAVTALVVWLVVFGPYLKGAVIHNIVVVPGLALLLTNLSQPKPAGMWRWLGSSVLVYLGRISYSFYITQFCLMFTLEQLTGLPASYVVLGGMLLLNLLLATLFYEVVEKRSHKWLLTFGTKYVKAQAPISVA